jgi:thiol-disulfide isomerase/thioredoxin
MMRLLGVVAAVWMALAAGAAFAAPPAPVLYVVNFTASWCPNCRLSDPALKKALLSLADPTIEEVRIDTSNDATWDASTQQAVDKGVVQVHNMYLGTTGLIVLTAADTGERIACLTARIDAEAMAAMIARAKDRVRATPPGQRFTGDLLCPKARQE